MAKRTIPLPSARLRAQALAALVRRLAQLGLKQKEAAMLLRVAQPQISALVNGRAANFSLDRLVDLAERAGLSVRLTVTRPYRRG